MTTTRLDTRRDYRHFPTAYTELLLRFQRDGSASIGPMTEREARSTRRDLYRFFAFLRNAPSDDEHASRLARITSEMVWRIVPVPSAHEYYLHATRNPIARWASLLPEGTPPHV